MGGRWGSDGGGAKKIKILGGGTRKKKSREENGMGVGRKKMGRGRGVEHYPPVLPHGANYPILKQWLVQIAMLWHSLNQCRLIISEVKWLLSVWSFIRMWWIKFKKKSRVRFDFPITDTFWMWINHILVKSDFIFLSLISFWVWINQRLNFDWFTSKKVSVIGKSNLTWLFAQFHVHLVQIRCTVKWLS